MSAEAALKQMDRATLVLSEEQRAPYTGLVLHYTCPPPFPPLVFPTFFFAF